MRSPFFGQGFGSGWDSRVQRTITGWLLRPGSASQSFWIIFRFLSRRSCSFAIARRTASSTGSHSEPASSVLTRSRSRPVSVHGSPLTSACTFSMPSWRRNQSGSVPAGRSEPRMAARLGVSGRRAHQTWRRCVGGALPVSRSRCVSAPTWWQGKPASIRRVSYFVLLLFFIFHRLLCLTCAISPALAKSPCHPAGRPA